MIHTESMKVCVCVGGIPYDYCDINVFHTAQPYSNAMRSFSGPMFCCYKLP